MSSIPDNSQPDRTDSLCIDIVVDDEVSSPIDHSAVRIAVRSAAAHHGYQCGELGIRVTTDPVIHQINRKHLNHDYPTDVISFGYHADRPRIEGELVVSVDTANRRAAELGWSATSELLLYIVHGTLHIVGLNDQTQIERAQMRAAEKSVMIELGVNDIDQFGADQKRFDSSIVEEPA